MRNYIITFIAGIVIGMLLIHLFPSRFINCDRLDCYEDTVTTVEYIKGKTDTILKEVVINNTLKPDTIKYYLNDSSKVVTEYKDTVLEATVVSTIKNNILVDQTLSYKLTYQDKYIYRTDTIRETQIISAKEKAKILLGGNLVTDLDFIQVGPSIGFQAKNGIITEVGYNFNKKLGNNILIGIKIPVIYIK
jgi:hypothetical protein